MDKALFDEIFDREIFPFIKEVGENNPRIEMNNLPNCKVKIYREYINLRKIYKEQIFGKYADDDLLDRHKIASCICGAFLKVPIFNDEKLLKYVEAENMLIEVFFYYVNEFVAFYAALRFLSFFMVFEVKDDSDKVSKIAKSFPDIPVTTQNKKGFWNTVLFNLSQIKDQTQIGLEHYDIYSYAMLFYWLEMDSKYKLSAV